MDHLGGELFFLVRSLMVPIDHVQLFYDLFEALEPLPIGLFDPFLQIPGLSEPSVELFQRVVEDRAERIHSHLLVNDLEHGPS